MAELVRMPKMSDTMTEGVIAKWHKKVGDTVKSGELMAEIETDKATMDYESFNTGTVLYIGAKQGEAVKVNDVLAVVGKPGEDFQSLLSAAPSKTEAPAKPEEKASPKKDTSHIKAEIVRMPKMSDTMTDGVIAAWHKKVGDAVKKGELMAEIETDKATMEYESFSQGTLLYQGAKAKESVKVNGVLAIVGEKDADWKTLLEAERATPSAEPEKKAEQPKAVTTTVAPTETKLTSTSSSTNGRVKISPLAKKLAAEKGVDISRVQGSGDFGRIIKRDVENFTPSSSFAKVVSVEKYEDIAVSQMRKAIARRVSDSKFTAPHFYVTMEITMDKAMDFRAVLNEDKNNKVSFNDIIIKAVAVALRKHPELNVSWLTDTVRKYEHIHIGVAMATPDGLFIPVVRFADGKAIPQISQEVKEYSKKAQEKKLQPADWEGSTFTISNLGMFGVDEFTAIINPPNACILAVGGIKETPVVKNNQIVPGHVMKVTLSSDHRVVDGAMGAAFLKTLKAILEEPVRMFI